MENKPVFLKLNLKSTESHRLFWSQLYFNIEAILLLDKKIETLEEAKKNLENASLIIKMTPFKNDFKAKLFSHILGEEKEEKSKIIAFTAKINVFDKKVLDIIDIREADGVATAYGNSPINPDETTIMQLSELEKNSLIQELQKLVENPMLPHLREPFIHFFSEFTTDSWKERIPANRTKATLVPYQGLFPFSGAIERIYKDELYVLDDLYCTAPNCDCNEVNCLVLTIDPQSGRETVFGGFKYQFTKKTFKNMPDFPSQFNAQEWLKQFNLNQPISLPVLFEYRYKALRKLFGTV
jgi:hypothetical protein